MSAIAYRKRGEKWHPAPTDADERDCRTAVGAVWSAFLEKQQGGRGVLLGGMPGVAAGKVAIIGGGVVGTEAAKMGDWLRCTGHHH